MDRFVMVDVGGLGIRFKVMTQAGRRTVYSYSCSLLIMPYPSKVGRRAWGEDVKGERAS